MSDRFGIRPLRHQLAVEHSLVELLVDPAGHDLESALSVDAGRLAAHESHDSSMRWDVLRQDGLEAAVPGPPDEVIQQRDSDAAAEVAGVALLAILELSDVIAVDREGRPFWWTATRIVPLQFNRSTESTVDSRAVPWH